jgi:ubiquinone/menaquinone biosynthesis C-methylase UbiE
MIPTRSPVGRRFAETLGYPAELLEGLPSASVDAFAGVSNVSVFAKIREGATVLDLGCGAGLDSLIAARRTGPNGTVVEVDFSLPMLARASQSAQGAGMPNTAFCIADAENLPLRDSSITVALVNGIFNLNPKREAIFRELARVVKTGGAVYCAELVLLGPLPPREQQCETNWFA